MSSSRALGIIIIGLVLGLLGFLGVRALNQTGGPLGADLTSVTCIGGSEKKALMADDEVKKILADEYGLTVDFQSMGSVEQVKLATADIRSRNLDCLWPSSDAARLIFEELHDTTDFSGYRADVVFDSPEVIYTGTEALQILTSEGIVTQVGKAYTIDLQRLLNGYVIPGKTWQDLGAATLRGPIRLESTNPTQSNSGFTAFLLQLSLLASPDRYQPPSLQQARAKLPDIRRIYESQGLQSRSSGFGFEQWLREGNELSSPLFAGYENQYIEVVRDNPNQADVLTQQIVMLYPDPTVFNGHAILALNGDTRTFIDAMKDEKIQQIAWERYGFRSVILGTTDLADFPNLPLAERVITTNLPSGDVILELERCLSENKCTT